MSRPTTPVLEEQEALERSWQLPPYEREPKKRAWPKFMAVGLLSALVGLLAGYGIGMWMRADEISQLQAQQSLSVTVPTAPVDLSGASLGRRVPPLEASTMPVATPHVYLGAVDVFGSPLGQRVPTLAASLNVPQPFTGAVDLHGSPLGQRVPTLPTSNLQLPLGSNQPSNGLVDVNGMTVGWRVP